MSPHIAMRWPTLVAAGMVAMQERPKVGRPRLYSDAERKERQRERDRVRNANGRVRT